MAYRSQVVVLGDSILKGTQVDPATKRYITKNEMNLPALEAEFDLTIRNNSHFGATIAKGEQVWERLQGRDTVCDTVVMDFGGNDCDYCWQEIAAHPEEKHDPKVPLPEFIEHYRGMIRRLVQAGKLPVLTTLPPLVPRLFFDWWCGGLDQKAVRSWLGDVNNIYAHQERYSRAVEKLAQEERAPLVDLRGAFLEHGHIETLICEDGTHPNSAGQALIAKTFRDFVRSRREIKMA